MRRVICDMCRDQIPPIFSIATVKLAYPWRLWARKHVGCRDNYDLCKTCFHQILGVLNKR